MTGEAPVAAAAVEKKVEPEVTAKSEEEDNELVPNEDKQERTAKAMEAEAEKAEPIHPVAAVAEPKEEAVKEAAEEKAGGSMQLMMAQWMGASEDVKKAQEEIKAAREARKEVDDKFKKRLQDMLNGAQKDRLPTKKPTNQNPWDFGMFVEEEGEDE